MLAPSAPPTSVTPPVISISAIGPRTQSGTNSLPRRGSGSLPTTRSSCAYSFVLSDSSTSPQRTRCRQRLPVSSRRATRTTTTGSGRRYGHHSSLFGSYEGIPAIGWSTNLQSSRGVTKLLRQKLAARVAQPEPVLRRDGSRLRRSSGHSLMAFVGPRLRSQARSLEQSSQYSGGSGVHAGSAAEFLPARWSALGPENTHSPSWRAKVT